MLKHGQNHARSGETGLDNDQNRANCGEKNAKN